MAYQKVLKITRSFVGYRLFCQSWRQLTEFCELYCGGVSIPLMVYLIGQGAKVVKRVVSNDNLHSRKSLRITTSEEEELLQKHLENRNGGGVIVEKKIGWVAKEPQFEQENDNELLCTFNNDRGANHRCTLSNSTCSTSGKIRTCLRLREQALTCFFEELREVERQQEEDGVQVEEGERRMIRLCEEHYNILLKFTEQKQNTDVQRRKGTIATGAGTIRKKNNPERKAGKLSLSGVIALYHPSSSFSHCSTSSHFMLDPRLSNVLITSAPNARKDTAEISTPKDVVALTWFILAKVAAFDELYTSGVIRIDDPDARIFNFIDACDGVYERYSRSNNSG